MQFARLEDINRTPGTAGGTSLEQSATLSTANLADVQRLNQPRLEPASWGYPRIEPPLPYGIGQGGPKATDQLDRLYSKAVGGNPALIRQFDQDLVNILKNDKSGTFDALTDLAARMSKNPPPSPSEIGKELGDLLVEALPQYARHGKIDFQNPDLQKELDAFSGVMKAAQAIFGDQKSPGTMQMIDAMEKEMRWRGMDDVHAVSLDGSGDPRIYVAPNNDAISDKARHDWQPPTGNK